VQVPHCSWQSKALNEAPYKLSGAVARLASITFLSLAFSYWIDYLGFVTEGKLAAIFIKPSLRVSNWPIIYIINYMPTSSLALFNIAPPIASDSLHKCCSSWIDAIREIVSFVVLMAIDNKFHWRSMAFN
jgi:hypothetical protein